VKEVRHQVPIATMPCLRISAHACSFILAPRTRSLHLSANTWTLRLPLAYTLPSLPQSEAWQCAVGALGSCLGRSQAKNLMGRRPYQPAWPMRSIAQLIYFSLCILPLPLPPQRLVQETISLHIKMPFPACH